MLDPSVLLEQARTQPKARQMILNEIHKQHPFVAEKLHLNKQVLQEISNYYLGTAKQPKCVNIGTELQDMDKLFVVI